MRCEGSWGTNYEIMAAAACFNVYIAVFQPMLKIGYSGFGDKTLPLILLQNTDGRTHFTWMM
jgi:hypothetical protein